MMDAQTTLSKLTLILIAGLFAVSCGTESDGEPVLNEPPTYSFERNGESSVSFSGQTTRIQMGDELFVSMLDFDNSTEELLLQMYRNQTADGNDADPWSDADLNASDKSIKSKVAASSDYFASNATLSAELKNDFETWISAQINEVFPNRNVLAQPGIAGQIAQGSSTRYVSGEGLEYDQLVNKSLIGALMADQMLNNYLSPSVLDAGTNRDNNDDGVTESGTTYTTMEHKWDEAYGYIYGTAQNPANPNATIGDDDRFLNKYVGQVSEDEDFSHLATDIFDAFKKGRAAIVAGEYEIRDQQAEIIREAISKAIAVRGVYYLQAGKRQLSEETPQYGAAFHSLSEGYGFIYSLQFTREPGTNEPYLSNSEVTDLLDRLLGDGENGLWDVTGETLDELSAEIADHFEFTVEEAAAN
ncbi:MAG: DUF4856 domain-containing protein [Balneolaceae bacterium]